jgi:hypothetical protein
VRPLIDPEHWDILPLDKYESGGLMGKENDLALVFPSMASSFAGRQRTWNRRGKYVRHQTTIDPREITSKFVRQAPFNGFLRAALAARIAAPGFFSAQKSLRTNI